MRQAVAGTLFEEVDEEIETAFGKSAGRREEGGMAHLMDLTEDDWTKFLAGAKQRKYKKGDFVLQEGMPSTLYIRAILYTVHEEGRFCAAGGDADGSALLYYTILYFIQEGMPTAALFQILQGELRVELKLKDASSAVVVGHRGAGEMFGETSLLKAGVATASIVTDSDEAIVVCIEGSYLDTLFQSEPALPGRFFAFLASYQARRLSQVTDMLSRGSQEVTGSNAARVMISDIFSNPAYMGIFRKFMFRAVIDTSANVIESY